MSSKLTKHAKNKSNWFKFSFARLLSTSANCSRFHDIPRLHVRVHDEELVEHCNYTDRQEDLYKRICRIGWSLPCWQWNICWWQRWWWNSHRGFLWLEWSTTRNHFVIVLLGLHHHSHSWWYFSWEVRWQADTLVWHCSNKCSHDSHTVVNIDGWINTVDCQPGCYGALPRFYLCISFRASRHMDSIERTYNLRCFCAERNSGKSLN